MSYLEKEYSLRPIRVWTFLYGTCFNKMLGDVVIIEIKLRWFEY